MLIVFVRLGTLPYYRLYHFNTVNPIQKIASIASEQPRSSKLLYAVALWRERKLTELHFISIAVSFTSPIDSRPHIEKVRYTRRRSYWLLLLDHHRPSLLAHTWSMVR
jgi:hypothetical protein